MTKRSLLPLALFLCLNSCAKEEKPPAPGGSLAPRTGGIVLDEQGGGHGACKIQQKSPDRATMPAGGTFTWNVTNNCAAAVTLDVIERMKKPGTTSAQNDPLSGVRQSPTPIPAGGTGTVTFAAKTQAQLAPNATTKPPKEGWTYRWTVNGQRQNDPEIEIEYSW